MLEIRFINRKCWKCKHVRYCPMCWAFEHFSLSSALKALDQLITFSLKKLACPSPSPEIQTQISRVTFKFGTEGVSTTWSETI